MREDSSDGTSDHLPGYHGKSVMSFFDEQGYRRKAANDNFLLQTGCRVVRGWDKFAQVVSL
jgi:hypothetical protein